MIFILCTHKVQIQFNYLDYDDPSVESRKCYEVCQKFHKPVIVMDSKMPDTPDVTILREPYTDQELRNLCNEDNYVTGYVSIPLSDIIDCDFEQFLDRLATRLVNSECLMDISYDAVGIEGVGSGDTCIIMKVRGDVSDILDMDQEDEE